MIKEMQSRISVPLNIYWSDKNHHTEAGQGSPIEGEKPQKQAQESEIHVFTHSGVP